MTAKITTQSTKAEEIAFVRKVASQCEDGSYLNAFFSEKLLNWVEEHIESDYLPDLFGVFENESRKASALTLENESQDRTIKEIKIKFSALEDKYQEKKAEADDLRNQFNSRNSELLDRIDEKNLKMDELRKELEHKDAEIHALTIDMNSLKAELFDIFRREKAI